MPLPPFPANPTPEYLELEGHAAQQHHLLGGQGRIPIASAEQVAWVMRATRAATGPWVDRLDQVPIAWCEELTFTTILRYDVMTGRAFFQTPHVSYRFPRGYLAWEEAMIGRFQDRTDALEALPARPFLVEGDAAQRAYEADIEADCQARLAQIPHLEMDGIVEFLCRHLRPWCEPAGSAFTHPLGWTFARSHDDFQNRVRDLLLQRATDLWLAANPEPLP